MFYAITAAIIVSVSTVLSRQQLYPSTPYYILYAYIANIVYALRIFVYSLELVFFSSR